MRRTGLVALALSLLVLAAAAQATLAPRMELWSFKPDFVLLAVIFLSLGCDRKNAALVGFAAGLLQGAIPLSSIGAYIASRAVAGFCTSWTKRIEFELTPLTAAMVTFLMTALAGVLWMFLAVPREIGSFLADTIRTAAYNGLLAMPLCALIRRVEPRAR